MKKTIQEYTDYLFNCSFTDDSFDSENHEEHLDMSCELFEAYSWEDIYPVWIQQLHAKCPAPSDVINFVNLFFYYGAANRIIPNPVEFISYLYFMVDMDQYWDEAGDLFDGLTISVFSKNGLINMMEDPYYNPLKDERILTGVSEWKNGKVWQNEAPGNNARRNEEPER